MHHKFTFTAETCTTKCSKIKFLVLETPSCALHVLFQHSLDMQEFAPNWCLLDRHDGLRWRGN